VIYEVPCPTEANYIHLGIIWLCGLIVLWWNLNYVIKPFIKLLAEQGFMYVITGNPKYVKVKD